jgi:glycerol-3-phosphate acyltransferase PlsY
MVFVALALAYLIGSIPFGLILTRAAGLGDVRKIGSGNIGATNVMRTGRKGLGVLTLLLDGGKGFAAVEMAQFMKLPTEMVTLAGFLAVTGHVMSIWLRFKGGKGVATTIGVYFGLDWMLGATVCIVWLGVFLIMRISSLAALLSIGYSPIFAYLLDGDAVTILCLSLAAVIMFTHRSNISRLLMGKENNFTRKNP